MQPAGQKIDFGTLQREIGAAISTHNPLAINNKAHAMMERLLKELSMDDVNSLEKIVQSQPPSGSMQTMLTNSTIKSLVESVKKSKPEIDKFNKVQELLESGKMDEAVLVLNTMNDTLKEQVSQVRNMLADNYKKMGQPEKAKGVLAGSKKDPINESVAESAKTNAGIELMHAGMDNLRRGIPSNNLPSNSQMDSAFQGIHDTSAAAAGMKKDSSLEGCSIDELKAKLSATKVEYQKADVNFQAACQTGNQNIIMPALQLKSEIRTKLAAIMYALQSKGVTQVNDPAEVQKSVEKLNKSLADLALTIRDRTSPEQDQQPQVPPECRQS